MNSHDNEPNNSRHDSFDSTKKFNINDILSDVENSKKIDKATDPSDDASVFFKIPGDLSDSLPDSPKDIFDEIFDSQKKAVDIFEDTLDNSFDDTFTDSFSSATSTDESESSKSSHTNSPDSTTEKPSSGKVPPSRKTRKKKKFFKSNAWFVIRTLLLIFMCTSLICATALIGYMMSLDDEIHIEIEALRLNYSSIVYYVDEDGVEHEYERLYATQNRTWVNLEDMPEHLKNAAIAIEDHRFLEHNGVDWKRTLGASFNMFFKTKSDFGASTITQQLVKNLTGDNQDSVKRKLQEIMRARYLEKHYDKDTILELYLNTIFLGEGCYGVGTAADTYFGKDVSELTIAESAAIIGITNLPTYYNPYINPENNRKRCNNIINRMYELGMISKEEKEAALNEDLVFKKGNQEDNQENVQSYFVDQIIEDLLTDLTEECGYSKSVALHTIYSGGLKIYATVDPEIQSSMDEIFENDDNFRKYQSVTQPECAMVLMDPQNGNVVALRGGRGKKTAARVFNRATEPNRPPGSTIKPISVYAPAIEYGLITPFSAEDDAPMIFFGDEDTKKKANIDSKDNVSVAINGGQAGKLYPTNEDETFSGRTNILEGVTKSLNTISMRTLNKLGLDKSYNFLSANLGITSLSPTSSKNFAPLALGQTGISPLEMAAAYVPFANGGTYHKPRLYTKVLDNKGNVLIDKESSSIKAMSKKTVSYITYMLQKVITEGTGTKAKLERGMPAAGKTGTSSGNQDRWFVGYTPYYVGATWFGYDTPTSLGTTLSQALTTWKKVMDAVHTDLPVKNFETNKDFMYVNVCSKSGLLPNGHCQNDPRGNQVIAGYFHKDDVPTKTCDIHKSFVIDTTTNMLASEFCPEENKAEVVFMELNRYHNVVPEKTKKQVGQENQADHATVILGDEQYVVHKGTLPNNMFRFSGASASALNPHETCTAHTSSHTSSELPDVSDEDDSSSDAIPYDPSSETPALPSDENDDSSEEDAEESDLSEN